MDVGIIGGALVAVSAIGLAIYAFTNRAPAQPARAAQRPAPRPAPPQARPPEPAPPRPAPTPPRPQSSSSGVVKPKPEPKKHAPRSHPAVVGTYKILDLVGEGAMASVYKAEDTRDGHIVAVKLVQEGLQKDPEFNKRFQREMEISRSLTHPNIVKVFESGEAEGHLYMAMELIDGETLEAQVDGIQMPLFQVVRIAGQLVDGLNYAHQRELVHRDIKPGNVMVTKNGIPKLLDFGLALQQGMNRFTTVGAAMGTPTHMAPEALTTGNSDKKSDQYALGVVIYQMLTGRCPFTGPDPMNIAMQHVKNPPPSILAQREEVPPRLEKIVMRMLSKKPEERYPNLTQLQMEIMSAV